MLASPTTLIALLRTVAHGWRHESLADQAREIHRVGRDLHERLGTMSGHLGKLGRSLDTAVAAYNQAVGSWESRVLVAARRFEELDVTDDRLEAPRRSRRPSGPSGRSIPCLGAPRATRRCSSIRCCRDHASGASSPASAGERRQSARRPRRASRTSATRGRCGTANTRGSEVVALARP